MKKQLYTVVHKHRFGVSVYLVRSERKPSVGQVCTACDIDFDEDRDETITIDWQADVDIVEI